MPFRSYAKSQKYKTYFNKRKSNKPVKTIYKKHSSEPKTKTSLNKSAILTLAKQVKTLQLNRYGDRQYQYQVARMVPSSVPGSGPTLKNPIFFCASSFFDKEPIYRGFVDQGGNASFQQVGTAPSNTIAFRKPAYDIDIKKEFQWVEQQAGKNTVSRIEYLPLYMNYKISFMGVMSARDQPLRYRITMFRTKRQPAASTVKNFGMPTAAGAYWYMCADDYNQRNHFSKSFHEIISDKWVTFNPPETHFQNTSGGPVAEQTQRPIRKFINMNYTFKTNKPYKPNLYNDPGPQSFWTNIEEDECIWVLISSNIDTDSQTQGIQPTIQIERSLAWRDNSGTTPNMGP